MRRYTFISVGLVATVVVLLRVTTVVFSIFQRDNPAEQPSAYEARPDLRHREVAILAVSRSQSIPVKFEVQNAGRKTIRILSVQSSCNCVGTEIGTRELLAGSTTDLTLNVSLSSFERTKQVSCVLVTDDSHETHKRFSAKVTVMQPVQYGEEIIDFGQLRLNDSIKQEVTLMLSAKGKMPPKLSDLAGNSPALEVVPDYSRMRSSTFENLVTHRLPIVVTFKPDESTVGVPLALRASSIVDGVAVSAELPLQWRPERQFAISPQRAMMACGGESSLNPVSITVRRKDGRPFGITGVLSNSKLISASLLPSTSSRQAVIEVRWSEKNSFPERLVSTVIVSTDNPLEPRLVIPVVFVKPDAIVKF